MNLPSPLNLRRPMLTAGIGATPSMNAEDADCAWRITNNLPRLGPRSERAK